MDNSDIVNIVEIYNVREVNRYLEQKWIFLNVFGTSYEFSSTIKPIYVLGWDRTNGDVPDMREDDGLPY